MNADSPDGSRGASRREFLQRAAWCGAGLLASGAAGLLLHDRHPPPARPRDPSRAPFPRFAPDGPAAMAIVRGDDRAAMTRRAFEALGGIGRFIRPGDVVALKVNAAFASPPALCATSHPDLVRTVIALCLAAGAKEVRVFDNPINDPKSCFTLTGIGEAARSAGGRLMLPDPDGFRPATLDGGRLIRDWPMFTAPLDGATKLIGLAPVKDHHRSGASMTLKNWYGFAGGRRNVFHQQVHTFIAELARLVQPTLVLLDGVSTMMTNGPTGGSLDDLRHTRTLVASTDPVAADAFGASLLGRRPSDLPFIGKAAAAGAGRADHEALNPTVVDIS